MQLFEALIGTETETERGILTVAGSHGTKRGQGATGRETRMTDTTLSPPGEMTATPAGTDTSSPTGTGITDKVVEIIFKIASLLMEHTLVTANKYFSISYLKIQSIYLYTVPHFTLITPL